MIQRFLRPGFLLVALSLFSGPRGAAQQEQKPSAPPPQREEESRARIRAITELVVVPVTVKDSTGATVPGLGRRDFRLFEDNVEQKISVFSSDPFPISAVILLDDDLPTRTAAFVGDSAGSLTGGLGPADEAAVMLFEQFPRLVIDFTSDSDALHDRLRRLDVAHHAPGQGSAVMTSPPRLNTAPIETGVPQASRVPSSGSKNLDDAVLAAGEMLRNRGRDRRKIILIVSDGRNSHHNTAKYEDVLRVLLTAEISVYGVGVSEAVLNRGTSAIAKYAHSTAGDAFYAPSREDLENLYSRVLEQARNEYTLAYSPSGTDRTLEYHSIEVRVERPGLEILTREGYYAVPEKK
jgi:VWFA-related protein